MKTQPFRIGLVGAGALGMQHLRNLDSVPGCRVTLVADPELSAVAGAEIARRGAAVTGVAELLDPTVVDAVVVASPTHRHADVVARAVEAGLPVFCEKPLARTLLEAEMIRSVVKSHDAKVMVGHVVRYFPEYAAARALVLDGSLGRPASARLARFNASPAATGWYADPLCSGGVLLDMAIHDIDWCLWTFGPAARVHAVRAGTPDSQVVGVTLRHKSGVISYIDASWREDHFDTRLEMWGSEGFYRTQSSVHAGVEVVQRTGPGSTEYLPSSGADPATDDPYRRELAAAVDWFRGGPVPLATFDDGYEALRVTLAAEESVRTGAPVMPDLGLSC